MNQVQILLIVVLLGIVWGENCPSDWGNQCQYDAFPMKGCQEEGDNRRDLKAMGDDVDLIDNEEYPFMVSLQTLKCGNHELGTGCYEHFCGGTMISPNLILTSAICADYYKRYKPSQTLNGQQYYTSREPIYAAISPQCRHLSNEKYGRFQVNSIFIHPEYYNDIVPVNDVAILEIFRKEGQYYEGPVVDIATEDMVETDSEALMLGYGEAYPEHAGKYLVYPLHGAEVSYLEEQFCYQLLDEFSKKYLNYTNMMCYLNFKAGSCDGDTGGPLLTNQSMQIGLSTWGPADECYQKGARQSPSIFVRLSLFADWIEEIIMDYSV